MFFEIETKGTITEWKHYINAPSGLLMMRSIKSNGAAKTDVYFHKDHLGSITIITNHIGAILEQNSFDAFGKRRNSNGSDATTTINSSTRRGFTQHEMLPEVNMIHMNGRVYEPTLGRFMSADPYVQFAGFSQSYNRYSYGFNNPFAGWAASSYLSGYDVYLAGGGQREIKKSWLISVGTAAAFYGVGSATEAVGAAHGEGAAFAFNVAGHAAVGCASASVGRGNCGQGALSAGFGAAAGAINTGNGFGNFLVAAVAGGIGAELGGGKFANGAVTGAFGYLFNQALHYNKQTDTLIVNKTVTLYHMTGEPPVIQWSGTIEWRTEIPIDALLERSAGPVC